MDSFPDANPILCMDWNSVVECFDRLKTEMAVSFDIETTALDPFPPGSKIYSIGFGFLNGDCYGIPLYLNWSMGRKLALEQGIARWLSKPSEMRQVRIGHNMKFDMLWILNKLCNDSENWRPVGKAVYEDTILMAGLIDSKVDKLGLKPLAKEHLGAEPWDMSVKDIAKEDVVKVLKYNALDCYHTLRLWKLFTGIVNKSKDKRQLFDSLLMPAALAFLIHELKGVEVDVDFLDEYAKKLDEKILKLKKDTPLNMESSTVMTSYFYSKGYALKRTSKGSLSVGTESVQAIADKHKDKIAINLLNYRGLAKMQSTYALGMKKWVQNKKIHPIYNLASTITGRTSCRSPNMQNWPKRADSTARKMIVPPDGHVIASFDYGQIEARLFGVITGDPVFCKAIFDDYDIHLENANFLFGKKDGHKYRNPVKGATFAMLYGAGDAKVAATAGVDISKVIELRAAVFSKWRNFRIWQKDTENFMSKNGYVRSLFGRDRHAPMGYSEMLNHCCQSSASDITLSALVALPKYRLMAMIHDDLSFYLPEDGLYESVSEIMSAMLSVPWLFMKNSPLKKKWVPLQVECSIAEKNWCESTELVKMSSLEIGLSSEEDCIQKGEEIMGRIQ